jgi:outer membrane receptor protein involved in Fe transport
MMIMTTARSLKRPAMTAAMFAIAAGGAPPLVAAAENSGPASAVLEEIVVTAQKRAEPLERVPAAITALSQQFMDTVQATSLSDLASYIPGLNVQSSGTDANRLVIRGLTTGPNDISPSVGVYVDDAPFGSNSGFALGALFSPDIDPSDLERVEVLKGPQGTLYGASTLSGLVKYVTKAPDPNKFDAHARLDFDRDTDAHANTYAARAGVNLPIAQDKIALRVNGFYSSTDGVYTDVRTGQDDLNGTSKRGGRADLLIRPIDDLSIDLIALTDSSRTPRTGLVEGNAVTLVPTYGQYSGYDYVIGSLRSTYSLFEGNIHFNFANGMTATSTSSYSRFAVQELADDTTFFQPALGALGPLLEFRGPVSPTTQKYTQEFRLASATNNQFEWLVGAFYDHERSDYLSGINSTYLFGATPPPVLAPTVAALANYETVDNLTHYTEFAGFGDATYYFNSSFDLSAGLRYSHNYQDRAAQSTGFLVLIGVIPATSNGTSNDHVWTESVAARFHFDEKSMLYARFATGYRPGGPNSSGTSFDPDTTHNYELGYKTVALDGRLHADADVFYVDWKNIQLNFFNGTNTIIGNAGDAHSRGAELHVDYAPITAISLQGNVAYTDAFISSLVPGAQGGAAVGDQLPFNSKVAASVLADYHVPGKFLGDWSVGGGLRYRSSTTTTFPGDPGTRFYTLPATTFVDLRTQLIVAQHTTINLQVLNVANQRKLSGASQFLAVPQATADALGQPVLLNYTPGRTVGLSVSWQY